MTFQTLIDVDSLRGLLGRPKVVVLDCRFDLMKPDAGRLAYLNGHIPGARYADLNRDLSAPVTAGSGRHPLPAPSAFAERLSHFGVENDTQVIAYDEANGSIAARLWWMLRWLGHTQAAVLDGGLKAWTAQGGALQSGDASPGETGPGATGPGATGRGTTGPGILRSRPAHFSSRVDAAAVVGTADVLAAIDRASVGRAATLLVDARAAERYAGTVEPIDSVAGHVPDAVNHPFTDNLDSTGHFLPAAEIRRRWLDRLAGTQPAAVIAMCGSGVTACHNLLALEVAGLPGGRLYAGSWSEWIRDPRRPVERVVT